ncbi:MAG: alpha/beta hydrolase-fold protein [Acidobacteriota bacterium]|nr:alpha/beta hydrolase-fold protein [Blastocatellia bacterium]MDW8412948.1 alpha/beta hydrolase-fold protein [Acidobacteriota bacterium]
MLIYLAAMILLSVIPAEEYPKASVSARYELALRTRRVERAWRNCTDKQVKEQVTGLMKQAVADFFIGRPAMVAATLDKAARLLEGKESTDELRLADALAVAFSHYFLSTQAVNVGLSVQVFYESVAEIAKQNLVVEISEGGKALKTLQVVAERQDDGFKLAAASSADRLIDITVKSSKGKLLRKFSVTLSRADDPTAELAAINKALSERLLHPVDMSTIKFREQLLTGLLDGRRYEIDYQAVQLLNEMEHCLSASKGVSESVFLKMTGDMQLAVPRGSGGGDWPVRVYVPKEPTSVAVVTLHGAGGSENMFFEGYGDGLLLELCKEKNWLLIAPKVNSPLDDYAYLLDRLSPLLSGKRILLLGHSLGAIASLVAAQKSPERFSAVAVISGSPIGELKRLKDIPIFVAVGTEDFSLRGSGMLAKLLAELQANVVYKTYEAEHLLVVTEALPDIVEWFSSIIRGKSEEVKQLDRTETDNGR